MTVGELREKCKGYGIKECSGSAYVKKSDLQRLLLDYESRLASSPKKKSPSPKKKSPSPKKKKTTKKKSASPSPIKEMELLCLDDKGDKLCPDDQLCIVESGKCVSRKTKVKPFGVDFIQDLEFGLIGDRDLVEKHKKAIKAAKKKVSPKKSPKKVSPKKVSPKKVSPKKTKKRCDDDDIDRSEPGVICSSKSGLYVKDRHDSPSA